MTLSEWLWQPPVSKTNRQMEKVGLAICLLIVGIAATGVVAVILTIAYTIIAALFSVL